MVLAWVLPWQQQCQQQDQQKHLSDSEGHGLWGPARRASSKPEYGFRLDELDEVGWDKVCWGRLPRGQARSYNHQLSRRAKWAAVLRRATRPEGGGWRHDFAAEDMTPWRLQALARLIDHEFFDGTFHRAMARRGGRTVRYVSAESPTGAPAAARPQPDMASAQHPPPCACRGPSPAAGCLHSAPSPLETQRAPAAAAGVAHVVHLGDVWSRQGEEEQQQQELLQLQLDRQATAGMLRGRGLTVVNPPVGLVRLQRLQQLQQQQLVGLQGHPGGNPQEGRVSTVAAPGAGVGGAWSGTRGVGAAASAASAWQGGSVGSRDRRAGGRTGRTGEQYGQGPLQERGRGQGPQVQKEEVVGCTATFVQSKGQVIFWRQAWDRVAPNLSRPVRVDGVACPSKLCWLAHTLGHEMLHVLLVDGCKAFARDAPSNMSFQGHGVNFLVLNWFVYGHRGYTWTQNGLRPPPPLPLRL